MESSTINPDSEEKKTPRRRAAGEQFGRWFPDMMPDHLKDKTEKDDDDDETDDNGKPKHATLKPIFSADKPETPAKELSLLDRIIVSKPEDTPAEENAETTDAIVSEATEAAEPELAAETALEGAVLAEAGLSDEEPVTEIPIDTVAETPAEASVKPATETIETAAEGGGQEPPEVPPTAEQAAEPPDDEEDDKRTPAAAPVRSASRGSGSGSSVGSGGRGTGARGGAAGAGGGAAAPISGESGLSPGSGPASPDTIIIREHERVIERRGGGLAALALLGVGAEYFGRRRADRKLERRTGKKLDAVNKQAVANESGLRHQIEQLARKNREEVGQIKVQEQRFDSQLQDRPKIEEVTSNVAMTKESRVQPAAKVEKSPELATARALFTPDRRPSQRPERPVASFERPAAAPAELVWAQEVLKKEPVEQIYELRHELKDNSALQIAAAAASAGPLLTATGSARSAPAVQPVVPYPDPSRDRAPDDKQLQRSHPELYRQAMTMGLWGALMIIIFGLLVYFLVH